MVRRQDGFFIAGSGNSPAATGGITVAAAMTRPTSVTALRRELDAAREVLHAKALFKAARFAAELAAGLGAGDGSGTRGMDDNVADDEEASRAVDGFREVSVAQSASLALARSYFDCKEFARAARVLESGLKSSSSASTREEDGQTGRGGGANADNGAVLNEVQRAEGYMMLYSDYMAGYQRQAVANAEKAGPLGKWTVQNESSTRIIEVVEAAQIVERRDPFVLYVYALALLDGERITEARSALVESVTLWPWNWSAWLALQGLCEDADAVAKLPLPEHWMREVFLASVDLELQHNQESLSRYKALLDTFPASSYVLHQIATAHYNLREFDTAQTMFEDLRRRDPHRLEGMDIYSNILYVKEMLAELSHLAHAAVLVDKFRPETCCIVGNYYSLKGQHEKAVAYFKRALRVNPKYLSAWTLMGHEYVELKHPRAAINCYRRAVDINARDYRAWYGLGQTYEILAMPFYALYYYRQATQLRPMDARMWCAMGQCYEAEAIGMPEAAVRCYLRAEHNNDREGIALPKLGKLYQQLGQMDEAAECYAKALERMDRDQPQGVGEAANAEAVDAMLFLASHLQRRGKLREAEAYCMRLLDSSGQARDQAKAMLRELHSEQQQRRWAT